MKREQTLRHKLQSQQTLHEAVSAMRSLAAHHFRVARAAVPAARAYRQEIDRALGAIGINQPARAVTAPGLLVVAADLGLCDGYSSRIVELAIKRHHEQASIVVYVVGKKALPGLQRAGLPIDHHYSTPTSVVGLTPLLLELAQDTLSDYLSGKISQLDVVSAKFEGVGVFRPEISRVLPVTPVEKSAPVHESSYVRPAHLVAVAVREFLYILLYELLLNSLAAEHGARLVATEAAEEWLSQRMTETQRQIASICRENSTQEILDVAAGARNVRRNRGP